MNKAKLKGVSINLDVLKDIKSADELKAKNIFNSLPATEQAAAYDELFKALNLSENKKIEKTPPPAKQ